MPYPIPPSPPKRKTYTAAQWGFARVAGGLADVFDDLVGFIPLGPALKQDRRLLVAKYTLPWIVDLFPEPPSFGQLDWFGDREGNFLIGIEKFLSGQFRPGADQAIASLILGVLDSGEKTGVVTYVQHSWRADP